MTPSTFLKNALVNDNRVVVRDAEGELYRGSDYAEALRMAKAVDEVAIDVLESNGSNGFNYVRAGFFCEGELFDESV